MKLTLGQAAKEAGISKPSLSAAIKKGKLSASKNESGVYEIDPAELFRAYPKKTNTNSKANGEALPSPNPVSLAGFTGKSEGKELLNLLLAEHGKLTEEKQASIKRLEQEKEALREDLEAQREQTKRITLLLENRSDGAGEWQQSIKALEARIANQEKAEKERKEREQRILQQNKQLKEAYKKQKKELETEKNKSWFKKLLG